MQFSLEELLIEVPKILQSGHVNDNLDDYPILHHVMMTLRDDPKQEHYPRYLKLIKDILQNPQCDPDVLDQYGKTALTYVAEATPSIDVGTDKIYQELLNVLLKEGADPNLECGANSWTPLEWALHYSPTSQAIPVLASRTKYTQRLLAHCQKMFDEAIEDKEVDTINTLLDLGLVTYQRQFKRIPRLDITSNATNGYWIRVIRRPDEEKGILQKREALSDAVLSKMRHETNHYSSNPSYTEYSSCTYVRPGLPVSLFGSGGAGFMIKPSASPISYWYDGHREVVSNCIMVRKGEQIDNGEAEGQYWELTGKQVEDVLTKKFLDEVDKCCRNSTKDQEHYDRHGVLLDQELLDIGFSWNEGKLRYKRKDIFGVCVDPNNKQSSIDALKLRQKFDLQVPLYFYNDKTGQHTRVASADLIKKWNLSAAVKPKHSQRLLLMSRGYSTGKALAQKPAQSAVTDTRKLKSFQ